MGSLKTVKAPIPRRLHVNQNGQPGGTKNNNDEPPNTTILDNATALVLPDMQCCSSHCLIIEPNNRCSESQRDNLGEERAKHQALNKTKGVVGNTGRTIPIIPRDSDNNPSGNQNFTILYFLTMLLNLTIL